MEKNLDLPSLRSFVAAVDLGGFGRAAQRLHRTPGAISLQLKALESRLGQPLFSRDGKRQRLTAAGESLLVYARRLLEVNDEALLALRGLSATGDVRLGLPQDLADSWLPRALASVARTYPSVRLQLRVGRSAELGHAVGTGELDLAVTFARDASTDELLSHHPVSWWSRPDLSLAVDAPVPLLVLDGPCLFREQATQALDKVGRSWRIAMSSGSVSALWSGATAGLGITPRANISVPSGVVAIGPGPQLPLLGPVRLQLHVAEKATQPIVEYLRSLLINGFTVAQTA